MVPTHLLFRCFVSQFGARQQAEQEDVDVARLVADCVVKAFGKAFQGISWQADDQVQTEGDAAAGEQAHVLLELVCLHAPVDRL